MLGASKISRPLSQWLYRSRVYSNRIFGLIAWTLWLLANAIYGYYELPYVTLFGLATFVLVGLFIWRELNQFSNSGLIRLDHSVGKGLSYDHALRLCTNQIDFLGIGAAKLTSSPEFEKAIERCHRPPPLGPMRFLLTKPDNPLLTKSAKQRGVNPSDYSQRVNDSLEKLSRLKNDRSMNIEVRFYPSTLEHDLPLFRLMFINDALCLLSYNVFGEGDGSQLPQLHLKKFKDEGERDVASFYYPFRMYFEKLWEDSSSWDFQMPVK